MLSPVIYEYAPSSVDAPPLPGTTLALSLLAVLNRKLDIDGKFDAAVLEAHADRVDFQDDMYPGDLPPKLLPGLSPEITAQCKKLFIKLLSMMRYD